VQSLPAWDAADIGASARMSDGRIAWAFGDTLRTGMSPEMVANSLLISTGPCVSQVMPADGGPVIPDADPARRIVHWPMSVLAFQQGERQVLAVLCGRIRRGGSGDGLDFTFLGTSAAVFDVPDGGAPQLLKIVRITEDDPDPYQVNWGAASFHDDRWMYVYGTRLPEGDLVFGRELYVARVPLASPEARETYEFWDGTSWQSDRTRAAVIMPSQGGVSQTLSVDALDGRFVAVSKRDGDLGEFVYSWTAPTPHGPWSPYRGIAAPSDFDKGLLRYAPLAHPEVPVGPGRLLVSVSRNTTDLGRLVDDPELGVPRFVEVDLPHR
jgi:Domain of unknown function (DUF4185)